MSTLTDRWFGIPLARRKRLVLLVGLLAFIVLVMWSAQGVLLPFGFGLLMAYLLTPLVEFLDARFQGWGKRRGLRWLRVIGRSLAIVIAYLLVLAILVGFISLVVPMVVDQAQKLWAARDAVSGQLGKWIDDITEQYRLLPPTIQQQAEEQLGKLGEYAVKIIEQTLTGTAGVISYTLSLLLAFLIVPFWTFFVIKDSQKLQEMFYSWIPDMLHADISCLGKLVGRTLGAYLRGQLVMGLAISIISLIGFTALGLDYTLLLAVIAGIFELVPNIGPWLGGIPAVVVALTRDPTTAMATAIFILILQQVENVLLAPRIIGESVQLHPVVIMLVLIIGSEIAGLLGLFLAPIVAALVRDVFRYFYYRSLDEPLPPQLALQRAVDPKGFHVAW